MAEQLLLHICCAPDEAWVVHTLRDSWDLHCFFCNPNIQPQEEYVWRLEEARRVADHYGVPFDGDSYDPDAWENAVRGLEGTGEAGARCRECFLLRLRRTAAFGAERGLPAFTTVMSVSPHKRIAMLHEAGGTASQEHGVRYVPFDFKKQDGFRKSVLLSTELGIYRQDYCGCRLSRFESETRRNLRRRREVSETLVAPSVFPDERRS
jgi:hypothetical protein